MKGWVPSPAAAELDEVRRVMPPGLEHAACRGISGAESRGSGQGGLRDQPRGPGGETGGIAEDGEGKNLRARVSYALAR